MNLDELLKAHPEKELDIAVGILKGRSWWEWTDQITKVSHAVFAERVRVGDIPTQVNQPSKDADVGMLGPRWTQYIELAWSLVEEMIDDGYYIAFSTPCLIEEFTISVTKTNSVFITQGKTMPIAICNAYLKWREKCHTSVTCT